MGPSRISLCRISTALSVVLSLAALVTASSLSAQVSSSPAQVTFNNLSVGQQTTQTVNFTVGSTALGSVAAVTQGIANADYTVVPSGTTCAAGTINAPCMVEVQFQPQAAGSRYGALVLADGSGNTLSSVPLFGIGTAPVVAFLPGTMSTVAGGDVASTTVGLAYPSGIGVDAAGNIYVPNSYYSVIYKITPAGLVTRIAGGNGNGYKGDGGLATSAKLFYPYSVRLDGAGNIYITDYNNNAVRMINPAGIITTVAGLAPGATICGQATDQWGDGCPATQASLDFADSYYGAGGTVSDGAGNLYIGDTADNLIRKVGPDGTISIFAGTGVQGYSGDGGPAIDAQLNNPDVGALDSAGNLYFSDLYNNVVRKIAPDGTISTVAGTGTYGHTGDGGLAVNAELGYPYMVAVDAAGDLYITDSGNFTEFDTNEVIRKVTPSGIITTVAGMAPSPNAQGVTYSGDGGPATSALMWGPVDIALDGAGNLYIADSYNAAIRKVDVASPPALSFPSQTVGVNSPAQNLPIQNIGNANLAVTSVLFGGTNGGDFSQTNNCSSPVAAGAYCQIGVTFAPLGAGPRSGAINVADNAPNSPQSGVITGTGLPASTQTVLSSSLTASSYGQPVTFTATVTPPGRGTPTGSVSFYDDKDKVASASLNSGVATLTLPFFNLGTQSITASYSGDTNFLTSASNAVNDQVTAAPTSAVIVSTAAPAAQNESVTYTVVVSSPFGNSLTGDVTLKDGATTLGLFAVGMASYTTSYANTGLHSLTATYTGDTFNTGSTATFKEYVEVLPVTTLTKVVSSGTPSVLNQPVTFTATVTSTYGSIPTGDAVDFYDGTTLLGPGTLVKGVASLTTSSLTAATHSIKATYLGDASFATSTGTVSQVVQPYTTATALSASPNPSSYGQVVILTAQVTTAGPNTPTGTVTFKNASTTLGSGTLNSSGVATLSIKTLAIGSNSITASYNGDAQNGKSTSAIVSQIVNQAVTGITLTSTPNPSKSGTPVKFTAVLTSTGGGVPTGSVTFTYNGSSLGMATISAGTAVFSTPSLPLGADQVTASFAGTVDYSAASVSTTQTVNSN